VLIELFQSTSQSFISVINEHYEKKQELRSCAILAKAQLDFCRFQVFHVGNIQNRQYWGY